MSVATDLTRTAPISGVPKSTAGTKSTAVPKSTAGTKSTAVPKSTAGTKSAVALKAGKTKKKGRKGPVGNGTVTMTKEQRAAKARKAKKRKILGWVGVGLMIFAFFGFFVGMTFIIVGALMLAGIIKS